jgi:hypothetical protein
LNQKFCEFSVLFFKSDQSKNLKLLNAKHIVNKRLVGLGKVFYGFRFDPAVYSDFKHVVDAGGCTITGAFERFMHSCVEADGLVFAEQRVLDFEAEARVLVDWLGNGKYFYDAETGKEVSVQGRLLSILPKVHDTALKKSIEDVLKKSATKQKN